MTIYEKPKNSSWVQTGSLDYCTTCNKMIGGDGWRLTIDANVYYSSIVCNDCRHSIDAGEDIVRWDGAK